MAKKGFEVELSAKTSGLKKAFKEIDKESRKITKELRKVNRGLYFSPKSTELLAQKQELLGNRINETRKKLDGLKKAEKDMKKAFEKGDLGAKEYREFKREIVTTENKLGNFNRQLKETKKQATNAKYNLDGLKSAASTLATGITATVAGLTAMGIVVGREINKTMEYADEVDKLSQQIGLSREATQEWTFVAEQNGSSIESLSAGIQRFTRNVGNAADGGNKYSEILSDIGVEIKDTDNSLRSMNDIFPETIKQLASMEKGTERNAAVMELFGRRGSELIPILNQSEEDIAALIKQANDLDLVMDEEDIQSWVDMKDEIHALTEQFSALKREMVNDLLPFLQLDLLPFIDEKLLPSIEKITDAFSYGWTSFSYEGGKDAKKAIQSIKDLSTAQDLLAEKQKELADTKSIEELSTWEKISMSAEDKQNLHEERRLLEDEIQLLEYRVENWDLLNSKVKDVNKNKEDTGGDIVSDGGLSDLEKFNNKLEEMIQKREEEQEIASRDRKVSQIVKRLDIEKEALKDRARELEASNTTIEKIEDLFNSKQEDAIKEAKEESLKLEKEKQNELALLKKEGKEKELEQLRQQEEKELESAKGKEDAINEIEEKYQIKRQEIREKYAEKEKKLQNEIVKNKYEANVITREEYKEHLEKQLEDYKEYSNKWIKINNKIKQIDSEEIAENSFYPDWKADQIISGENGKDLKEEVESLNWLTDEYVALGYEIEEANKAYKDWEENLSQGLSEAIAKGESLTDVFSNLADKMAEMVIQKAIVDPFLDWGLGKIGLPTFHEGGPVSPASAISNIKKYHSGGPVGNRLNSDEEAAVVQHGEYIMSKDQVNAAKSGTSGGTRYDITINAVDSQSFQQAIQRNPEAIVSVVTQDIMRNGNTRKAIKKS